MHLSSNNLSIITTISSSIISALFPACFSCNNNFNLSHYSLGSDDRDIVFETLEPETIKPGELSNFIRVRPLVDLIPCALSQSSFPSQNHTLVSYPLN